jgi:GT2 family glycosyltransferase
MQVFNKQENSLKVSIVIVSFNQAHLLEECINSIIAYENMADKEIIVIDNNSADGYIKRIPAKYKQVKMHYLAENIGFGNANNYAVKNIAMAENILFLNPDALLVMPIIDELVDFIENKPCVNIIGPRLLNPDRSIQPSTHGYPGLMKECFRLLPGINRLLDNASFPKPLFCLLQRITGLNLFARYSSYSEDYRYVKEITGACFLIKKRVFNNFDGFDPEYFMYLEEADLCYRIIQKGGKIVFYPKLEVIHELHGTSNQMPLEKICELYKIRCESLIYFFKKNYGLRYTIISKILLNLILIIRIIVEIPLILFSNKIKISLKKDLVFINACCRRSL